MPVWRIGSADDFKTSGLHCLTYNDQSYVLIFHQARFFLLDNLCPHKAAALCEGEVSGNEIHCPWHRARFDIESGKGLSPLAGSGVSSYPLEEVDGYLQAVLE